MEPVEANRALSCPVLGGVVFTRDLRMGTGARTFLPARWRIKDRIRYDYSQLSLLFSDPMFVTKDLTTCCTVTEERGMLELRASSGMILPALPLSSWKVKPGVLRHGLSRGL